MTILSKKLVSSGDAMQVGIAYSENVQQVWLTIEVSDDNY